tara:strand:+ start:103 stop:1389 length:1287 start_codon:yes stop_codon:yes gene_type:complete
LKLIKTSLLNSVGVLVKVVTLICINKILAVYVGPIGYLWLGQFQNFVQVITIFASGAINTGVIKYTAEHKGDINAQVKIWGTAGRISVIGSCVAAAVIFVFSEPIAGILLDEQNYASVLKIFALGLPFFVLNTLLISVLNGREEIFWLVVANVIGSLTSLLLTVLLTVKLSLYGALISVAIFQTFSFFTTLYLITRLEWFRFEYLFQIFDFQISKKLFSYTLMALVSAVCVPLSSLIIRTFIAGNVGEIEAGYWEAMSKLSGAYLLVFTSILSVYYLPKYAELKTSAALKNEILAGYIIILPVVLIGCCTIYLTRDALIMLLFSEEFKPMRNLFLWYQVGDFMKMGSWILAFLMLAKAMVKTYIATEIFFSISYVVMSIYFTGEYGLEGSIYAYAINYLLYWLFLAIFMYKTVLSSRTEFEAESELLK